MIVKVGESIILGRRKNSVTEKPYSKMCEKYPWKSAILNKDATN